MKFTIIYVLIMLMNKISISVIHNKNFPSCKNCKHFIQSNLKDPSFHFGKCGLEGGKNLISGEITHEYATYVRNDSNLCGIEGKNYKFSRLSQYHDAFTFISSLSTDKKELMTNTFKDVSAILYNYKELENLIRNSKSIIPIIATPIIVTIGIFLNTLNGN